MKSSCLPVAMGLMILVCGCNKQTQATIPTPGDAKQPSPASSTDPGADLKPVNPDDTAKAQEATRKATFIAMRRGMVPPPPALKLRGGELATPEVMAAYNQELLRAIIQERESPETLEDLNQKLVLKLRLLPRLPTPPSGQKIVYDARNFIIRLNPP